MKYKVGDKVKFEIDTFEGIGLIVGTDESDAAYLIELPKEYYGLGHRGALKYNYKEDNYYWVWDKHIEYACEPIEEPKKVKELCRDLSSLDLVEQETIRPKNEVHHPVHYNMHKHECIKEMIAVFGIDATMTFCKLNAWKYRYRAPYKDDAEKDLKKADEYLDILLDLQNGKY